jgi:hypothetical protein
MFLYFFTKKCHIPLKQRYMPLFLFLQLTDLSKQSNTKCKRFYNKALTGAAISTMLFAGGCSGGSSETVSESSDGKVVLDYWHTYSDQEEVLNEKI